jgi:hypothetical protein
MIQIRQARKIFLHLVILGWLALASVVLAYQSRAPLRIAIAEDVYQDIQGFIFAQSDSGHAYRWTGKDASVKFVSVGKTVPTVISIVAYAWRNETQVYSATVTLNGQPIGVIDRANWRTWRFIVSDPALLSNEDWVLGFHANTFFVDESASEQVEGNRRGIAIESVELAPQANGITVPSFAQLVFVVLLTLATYLATRWLGVSDRWALGSGVAIIIFFGLGIAFFRQIIVQRELILAFAIGAFACAVIVRDVLRQSRQSRWVVPASVMLIAFILRVYAIPHFYIEGDDGLYMQVAEGYYQAMRAGNWGALLAYDGIIEHPRLYVIVFALGLLVRDGLALPLDNVFTMRLVAATFGTMQAGLLALLNPLAGWFVAIQTTEIKFTSMAYLEALPALAAALSVIGYEKFRRTQRQRWLYISALSLGAAGASKFIYAVVGFAIAPFLLWEQRRHIKNILMYGALAAFAFFAFDPYLWLDPLGRLQGMFSFHASFSTREYVKELNRPWWYNWLVLSESAKVYHLPYEYQPPFVLVWDLSIYILGILGLPSLWRRSRLYIAWFIAGLIFIALWEAKWEQYAMIIATPLCLSAGYFTRDAIAWLGRLTLKFRGEHFENVFPITNAGE